MAKDKPEPKTGKDDDIFGGPTLLNRLSKGKSVIEATSKEDKKANAKTAKRQSAKAPRRRSTKEASTEDKTIKVSVYLTQNDLDDLDQQVIASRKTTGRKKDRSELIREAVRYWLESQR